MTTRDISYSDDTTKTCRLAIWDDLHNERSGYYRAYWESLDGETGSAVIGYCSPGGSHRTIRACLAEVRRMGYTDPAYRNGRLIPERP